METYTVIQVEGSWHVVAMGSEAHKNPSIMADAPGWPTEEQAEKAAEEMNSRP